MHFSTEFRHCLLALGFLFLFSGKLSFDLINRKISEELKKRLPLVNGTDTFQRWSKVKLPVYLNIHLFHVVNPFNVTNGGKPILEEKGPFAFKVKIEREILNWNEDETLVTFKTHRHYFFDPEKSQGSLDDNITILNLPLTTFSIWTLEKFDYPFVGPLVARGVEGVIESFQEQPFVNKTVGEVLFAGYDTPFLGSMMSLGSKFHFKLPNVPKDGIFGIMRGKNGSDDGVWSVNTGKENLLELGNTYKWNNQRFQKCWHGQSCNEVKGSDATIFHPFTTADSEVFIFSVPVNRTVRLTFEKYEEVRGVPSIKFSLPKDVLMSGRTNRNNTCFCQRKELLDKKVPFCSVDGILDLSNALDQLPIVGSWPHFYQGSPYLHESIEGLHPNKEKHENFIQVDPVTGVLAKGARRLQMNVHLRNLRRISSLSKLRSLIFPFIWLEETVDIDEETAEYLLDNVHYYVLLSETVGIALASLGTTLVVAWCGMMISKFFRKPADDKTKFASTTGSYAYVYAPTLDSEQG